MSPNFDNWLGSEGQPIALAELISYKSTSITIVRGSTTLDAQTVRLETLGSQRQILGQNGQTHIVDAMILAPFNHPTLTDGDLQAGDRFNVDGVSYEVVIKMPAHVDCIQCFAKVRA